MKEQIVIKKSSSPAQINGHHEQQTLFKNNQKELSILDRYLNNEEQIGYKYRHVTQLLERVYCENGFLLDDYSLSEYIVNQEGISFATFSQSIKEKYQEFEWSDILLRELYDIINEHQQHTNNNNNNIDLLNTSITSGSQVNKSFRKVRDIKYASQQKKKQNSSSLNNNESFSSSQRTPVNESNKHTSQAGIIMQANTWKQEIECFFNSNNTINMTPIKRERKGSLPEIKLNLVERQKGSSLKDNKSTSESQSQRTHQSNNGNNFVLEVLRTSMFRSKSATDLTNLAKSTSTKSIGKNFDFEDEDDESLNTNSNKASIRSHSTNCTKCLSNQNDDKIDSYRGLVWQCADMCYQEFINKYSELKWLLDGGIYSIHSKLKEVEQRLSIDIKLYSNNKRFYLSTIQDSRHRKDSDAIHQRLLKQLNTLYEKINESKSLRLYLLLCEANTKSIDTKTLNNLFDSFYNVQEPEKNLKAENVLQGKSISNLLFNLYSFEALRSGFVYQFYVVYRYFFSSSQLLDFFNETFQNALR